MNSQLRKILCISFLLIGLIGAAPLSLAEVRLCKQVLTTSFAVVAPFKAKLLKPTGDEIPGVFQIEWYAKNADSRLQTIMVPPKMPDSKVVARISTMSNDLVVVETLPKEEIDLNQGWIERQVKLTRIFPLKLAFGEVNLRQMKEIETETVERKRVDGIYTSDNFKKRVAFDGREIEVTFNRNGDNGQDGRAVRISPLPEFGIPFHFNLVVKNGITLEVFYVKDGNIRYVTYKLTEADGGKLDVKLFYERAMTVEEAQRRTL